MQEARWGHKGEIGMTQMFLQNSNLTDLAHLEGLDCRVMENKVEQDWIMDIFKH